MDNELKVGISVRWSDLMPRIPYAWMVGGEDDYDVSRSIKECYPGSRVRVYPIGQDVDALFDLEYNDADVDNRSVDNPRGSMSMSRWIQRYTFDGCLVYVGEGMVVINRSQTDTYIMISSR